jgi:hypothetical protein
VTQRLGGRHLTALLVLLALAGCDTSAPQDTGSAAIQAPASVPASACPGAQGYQHATLGYRVCYPRGWVTRDYTAEPGAGGALSVVAFGPAGLPQHVPAQADFQPPLAIRVYAGPKASLEASMSQGNSVSRIAVAGVAADRVAVALGGPAGGELIVILEHEGDTFEIEKGPGEGDQEAFQALLTSFTFAQPSS